MTPNTQQPPFRINAAGSGPRGNRGSGDHWKSETNNIAVINAAGQIVAWYERKKVYRSTEVRAEFRDPESGKMRVTYRTPEGYWDLRSWFLAEAERLYGVKLTTKR